MINLIIRIFPYTDVNYNNVIKSIKFSGLTTTDSPNLLTSKYSVSGTDELCSFDVTSSSDNKVILSETTSRTVGTYSVPLSTGEEIKHIKHVEYLLRVEVDKVAINSTSVTNPESVTNYVKRFVSQYIFSPVTCKVIIGT